MRFAPVVARTSFNASIAVEAGMPVAPLIRSQRRTSRSKPSQPDDVPFHAMALPLACASNSAARKISVSSNCASAGPDSAISVTLKREKCAVTSGRPASIAAVTGSRIVLEDGVSIPRNTRSVMTSPCQPYSYTLSLIARLAVRRAPQIERGGKFRRPLFPRYLDESRRMPEWLEASRTSRLGFAAIGRKRLVALLVGTAHVIDTAAKRALAPGVDDVERQRRIDREVGMQRHRQHPRLEAYARDVFTRAPG